LTCVKLELSDLPLFSGFVFCKEPFQGEEDFKEHYFGPTSSQFKVTVVYPGICVP